MRKRLIYIHFILVCLFVSVSQLSYAQKRKPIVSNLPSTENKEIEVEMQRLLVDGMKAYFIEDYRKAIDLFKKLDPNISESSNTAFFMIAKCYSAIDSSMQAASFFEKSIQNNPENQYSYIELAKQYEKLGNLSGAQNALEKLISFSPQNAVYLEKLIELTYNQGKWERALSFVESLEKSEGRSEELTEKKQRILIQMNKVEEVIKEKEVSISSNSINEDFELKKIKILMEQKKWPEVEKLITGLLQKKPLSADYLAQLAISKYRQGLFEDCVQICNRSLANKEVFLEPFTDILIEILEDKQISVENADLLLNTIINRSNDELNFSTLTLFVKLNRFVQRWEETKKWALKLIQVDENAFDGWDNLVEANHRLKQVDEQIKNAENATTLFPSQSLFWLRLAQGYASKEDWKDAIEAAEVALEIPSNQTKNQVDALLLLGDCFIKANQKDKAIQVWKKGLSLEFEKVQFLNRINQYQN